MVQWTARSPSKWLMLQPSTGSVSSANPVVAINVVVIGSGQNDTAFSGPLHSWIEVSSNLSGRSDLFEGNTSVLGMAVEVVVEAAAHLTSADVRCINLDGKDVVEGSMVVAGGALILTAVVYDFERLPICRGALQIAVELSQLSEASNNTLQLRHQYGNTYHAVLPSSWIAEPGPYTLWLDGGAVTIHFEAVETSKSLIYIVGGLTAVGVVLVILFVVLVRRTQGSWRKRVEKLLMPMAGVATVALEAWDLYGDYYSYRSFLERRDMRATAWMEQLMLPYTLFFGASCIASVISVGLKLRIFAGFIIRMLGHVAHVAHAVNHEQMLADLKMKTFGLALVAVCEDLPMGTPSVVPHAASVSS
jgi:hypothetical protein